MENSPVSSTTYHINLNIAGRQCRAEAVVPEREITLVELLPLLWKFQDALIEVWREACAGEGKIVSCEKGCGACCRQMVPLSEIEILHLGITLQEMPAARQSRVRHRFALAVEKLEREGLMDSLKNLKGLNPEERRQLGLAYFGQGIPCPFLEEESCSIHSQRPSSCREYLVITPAAHCAQPTAGSVKLLRHPFNFSRILFSFSDGDGERIPSVVPLILALTLQEKDQLLLEKRFFAPQLFRNFLNRLSALLGR